MTMVCRFKSLGSIGKLPNASFISPEHPHPLGRLRTGPGFSRREGKGKMDSRFLGNDKRGEGMVVVGDARFRSTLRQAQGERMVGQAKGERGRASTRDAPTGDEDGLPLAREQELYKGLILQKQELREGD